MQILFSCSNKHLFICYILFPVPSDWWRLTWDTATSKADVINGDISFHSEATIRFDDYL